MPQVGLDRPSVMAIVGELIATGMPEHVSVRFDSQVGFGGPARSTVREKPGADSGAPRSRRKMNGERGTFPLMPAELTAFPGRSRGAFAGVPFLALTDV